MFLHDFRFQKIFVFFKWSESVLVQSRKTITLYSMRLFWFIVEAFVVCHGYSPPDGYTPNMANPLLDHQHGNSLNMWISHTLFFFFFSLRKITFYGICGIWLHLPFILPKCILILLNKYIYINFIVYSFFLEYFFSIKLIIIITGFSHKLKAMLDQP